MEKPAVTHVGNVPQPYFDRRDAGQRLIGVVTIPASGHDMPAEHFENAARTEEMVRLLRAQPFWDRLTHLYPRLAGADEICLAHDPDYVALVRQAVAEGEGWLDNDTLVSAGSYEGAALAVGAVLAAVDAVRMGAYNRLDHVFAIVRPAGHHASTRRAGGSCVFNNVAVAARYAQRAYGLERVAVIDWDVHHGNGTQEIFYEDPSVLFCSLHEYPGYPGNAGWLDEVGAGAGTGFNVNAPMAAGASDAAYLAFFDEVLLPLLDDWRPQLVLVSVGHDLHALDPTGDVDVTAFGIQELTRRTRDLAERCGTSCVFALEGGYNQSTLPELSTALVAALGELPYEVEDRCHPGVGVRPEDRERIDAVAAALAPHWPVLRERSRRS